MRSVRSGSSINNRRVSPVAWKSLMGVLLPSLCIGVGSVAWATETDLHATASASAHSRRISRRPSSKMRRKGMSSGRA